jgi:carboxynorspermidine decarboxylase
MEVATPMNFERMALRSPAVVFDLDRVEQNLKAFEPIRAGSGLRLLYSIKALPLFALLQRMLPWVDGFSVSSLFEAKLARAALPAGGLVHITTPGIRPDELDEIAVVADHVSFNSIGQWRRYAGGTRASCGLRINPQRSFGLDPRYDPCRAASKLGAPLPAVVNILRSEPEAFAGLAGLHVHTMFGSTELEPLRLTFAAVEEALAPLLPGLRWFNLGGGYVLSGDRINQLGELATALRRTYGFEVLFEPGKAIVSNAGFLVATVIDCFESGGQRVVVLDTTVNHLPEVFEYQTQPAVLGTDADGPYGYLLAGSSCLAGDLFGEYRFTKPLEIGARVVFAEVGAYALVKASRFNGINLPAIYACQADQAPELFKEYRYADYRDYWS